MVERSSIMAENIDSLAHQLPARKFSVEPQVTISPENKSRGLRSTIGRLFPIRDVLRPKLLVKPGENDNSKFNDSMNDKDGKLEQSLSAGAAGEGGGGGDIPPKNPVENPEDEDGELFDEQRAEGLLKLSRKERFSYVLGLREDQRILAMDKLQLTIAGEAFTTQEVETLSNPEYGRFLAEKILSLESLPYSERYDGQNGPELDSLYAEFKKHVATKRIKVVQGVYRHESETETVQPPEDFTNRPDLDQLGQTLADPNITPDQRDAAEEHISAYFKEAKRRGLFKGLDALLISIDDQIIEANVRNVSASQLIDPQSPANIYQRLGSMLDSLNRNFPALISRDQELARLQGVFALYIQRALGRFDFAINFPGSQQRPFIEGEFPVNGEKGTTRGSNWEVEYGRYYKVTGRTEDEIMIASESFFDYLKSDVTKSAQKIYAESEEFLRALIDAANKGNLPSEVKTKIRQGFQGEVGTYLASYGNEKYDSQLHRGAMNETNKDEGPERWLKFFRLRKAKIAAQAIVFDFDARAELLFSPQGSRGQLADNTYAQEILQDYITDIFVDQLIGIEIKDYPVGDQLLNPAPRGDRWLKQNLDQLGVYRVKISPEDLFEGFQIDKNNQGNIHIQNYENYQGVDLATLSPSLRKSVRLGGIQKRIIERRMNYRSQNTFSEPFDPLAGLTSEEREFYEAVRAESKNAYDRAMDLYGAFGEKSKRGGGLFIVDRNVNGVEFQDWIPIHWAEKFIQYAETWAKIKHANSPADKRVEAVTKARAGAVKKLKEEGFEATLTLDKIYFDAQGEVLDNQPAQTETVDFQTAVHHIYSRWTSHTYWGYQEEHRHLILADETFEAAKRIRAGISKPEDEDPVATQLLIIDPTLKRVRKFPGLQEREERLVMAAVEDSYQGHWRITRVLHRAFYDRDGDPSKIRIQYGLQDYGGFRKTIESFRALLAKEPNRYLRRFKPMLPEMPMHYAALSEMWGQSGVLGIMNMFAYQVGNVRMAGEMAMDKFIKGSEYAEALFQALVGGVNGQEHTSEEGLGEKPNNNGDKIRQFLGPEFLEDVGHHEASQNKFIYGIMDTFGRFWRAIKIMRPFESDIRHAEAALWIEKKDVFHTSNGVYAEGSHKGESYSEGEYNLELDDDRNTGSSRHSAGIFFDSVVNWFWSGRPRGGKEAYEDEHAYYAMMKNHLAWNHKRKIVDFIKDKFVR